MLMLTTDVFWGRGVNFFLFKPVRKGKINNKTKAKVGYSNIFQPKSDELV